jgi:hypothetical protein
MVENVPFGANRPEGENVEFGPEQRPAARIRFRSVDEESGRRNQLRLQRSNTNASQISVNSSTRTGRGRRHTVDPGTALPIAYRTVSFAIGQTTKNEKIEAERKKEVESLRKSKEIGFNRWSLKQAFVTRPGGFVERSR